MNYLAIALAIYKQRQEEQLETIKELNKNLKTYIKDLNDHLTIMEAENIVNGISRKSR